MVLMGLSRIAVIEKGFCRSAAETSSPTYDIDF